MHTPYTCSVTRSLPFVLAAMAIACSANDEPRPSAPESNGRAVPENNAEQGSSAAAGSAPEVGTFDDDTRDITETGDPSATGADQSGAGASADSDGDGLADSAETNTHVYRNKNDTGTDPRDRDSDDDGLSDGDEVLGTAAGLDLAKMGTNPLHKDILIEYDWFEDGNDSDTCAAHSHRPTLAALKMVSAAFAASPTPNPDGISGINIIHDYGQGGLFKGGNRIADSDGVIQGGVFDADFSNYRSKNFASNREDYFHYTLMPHRYITYENGVRKDASSGYAEILGDDLIVSLYCAHSDFNVASTIVHELGHNLGLRHGGDSDLPNDKPNYNSVMNYRYQFTGVDIDCTPPGDLVIDYSRNRRISLDEDALDENNGICGTPEWDWNGNHKIESQISLDINKDKSLGVLTDHDDWLAIELDWHHRSPALVKRNESPAEAAACEARPPGY